MMHRQAICIAESFGSDSFFASALSRGPATSTHCAKYRGIEGATGTDGGRRIRFEVQDYARVYETPPFVGRHTNAMAGELDLCLVFVV
mmetsp:Transcript_36107/g.108021  ORF Transcript_36107/g.108021 Transcript_36107/m.108021 type:complete len:88 (-) Transcript_36107:644-907(-)